MSIFNAKYKELEQKYEELKKYCNKLEEDKTNIIPGGGYNESGFDHIVSLGYNCEVSFRIRDYLNDDIDSFPLSWAYIHDQSKMNYIIEHLEDMFTDETKVNLMNGMLRCEKLNVSFHPKVSHKNLSEDNMEAYKDEALTEMNQRYVYLRNKFNELFRNDESTLFIIKCQEQNEYNHIVLYLRRLEKKLSEKYLSNKFFLLSVTDDINLYNILKKDSNDTRGCALISQFADDEDTEKGGDLEGWIEVINYFNHIKDIEYDYIDYKASTVGRKNGKNVLADKYSELKAWCDKLQEAKDWLLAQLENKSNECEKVKKELQELKEMEVVEEKTVLDVVEDTGE